MVVVLALDVATVSGFAVGEIGTVAPKTVLEMSSKGGIPQPHSGSKRMGTQNMSNGAFYNSYENWLLDMITLHNPDKVVYEAPFISGGPQMSAAFRLLAMAGITEKVCYQKSVTVFSANMGTVRKYFCGTGRASRDVIKKKIQEACDLRGWTYADDNESDALAVWEYTQACLLGGA